MDQADFDQLRALSLKALSEGVSEKFIRVLHAEEDFLSYNSNQVQTYKAMAEVWFENFRDNMLNTIRGQEWLKELPYDGRPVLCVGAGPSITDRQLRLLRGRDDLFIICVNKIAERLLRHRRPDLVVALHGTDEILPHFKGPRVADALLSGTVVALPTCAHPSVVAEVCSRTSKVWWYNASVPNTENVDAMMRCMSHGLPTFDTGGNVGLCSIIIAQEIMGAKAVAFMGMETCFGLEAITDDALAVQCDIVYLPDRKQLFAVPPVFKDYAISMGAFMSKAKDRCRFVNLTPVGIPFISARSWGIENMDLDSYFRMQKD